MIKEAGAHGVAALLTLPRHWPGETSRHRGTAISSLCRSAPFHSLILQPFSLIFFTSVRGVCRKSQHEQRKEQEPKRPHIKKPLNAFMLYMKEMRANVVAECTLKESAAINQILGRRVRHASHSFSL